MKKLMVPGGVALAFLLLAGTSSGTGSPPVEASTCLECHDAQAPSHARGPHAGASCTACHTGGAGHVDAPSKETAPAAPGAASCLTCHQKHSGQMNWAFSDHARAAVECRDCHGIHAPKAAPAKRGGVEIRNPAVALCTSCHEDVLTRLSMTSHHPILEGGLSCTSCHNPHGSARTEVKSPSQKCFDCHQSLRGPHAFEHPPVAEGCASCHNPHGSPNRKLLQVAQPMLCQQCHSITDNRHGQTGAAGSRIKGAALRNCTGCHPAVHGSSFDQHLRY